MLALEGDFAFSFLLGIAAAVNPCGFVMLPAYLTYFLGAEIPGTSGADADDDGRAGVRRALVVSAALSGGFIAVFLMVGAITRLFTGWLEQQSRWAGLAIGVAMVVAGVAMLFGWKPMLNTARLAPEVRRSRSVASMFLFGVAYAVASIGCSIGFLVSVILGTYSRHGYTSGVVATTMYGLGMALLVTAATVALAVARVGLVRRLRAVMPHLQTAAAVVMILAGAYLAWYWYGAIYRVGETDRITGQVESWQVRLHIWLQERGAGTLAIVLGGIVAAAAVFALRRRATSPPAPTDDDARGHATVGR